MPGETPVNKIPYPLDADAPDGPTQIKALADLLDTLKWGSRNVKLTAGVKRPTGLSTLTNSFADIPLVGGNLEINPPVESLLLVTAIFAFELKAEAVEAVGTIRLDEVDQLQRGQMKQTLDGAGNASALKITVAQAYALTLKPAENHVIKMRAAKTGGAEVGNNLMENSALLFQLLAL